MSRARRTPYRRLILEMGQGRADSAMMRLAAEFAHGLDLDLHGLFIEDEALLQLAALPFAREIRLPSHRWQSIDTSRLEAELRDAADAAQRRLLQAASGLGITPAFQVIRGKPHICIAGVCTPADIFMMPAPDDASPGGGALLRAPETSPASVLLVPRHPLRRSGPVVVVAGRPGDAALMLATRIAEANQERLMIVLPGARPDLPDPADMAGGLGIAAERLTFRAMEGTQLDDLLRSLGNARERIIIVPAGGLSRLSLEDAARLAGARGVPVLVLQPDAMNP